MKHWPIAIQVYSVRDQAEADFSGTMRRLKEMGYDGVELAGTYGMTVAQVKQILEDIGLALVSGHVGIEGVEDSALLDAYAAAGMRYIAVPWMPEPLNQQELQASMERLARAGKVCREKGMELLYHNHIMEFHKIGEKTILDSYYSLDEIASEIDLCWAELGGVDPAQYLICYSGRAPLVHIKDYFGDHSEGETVEQRPIGMGMVNVPALLAAAEAAGTQWLIVEQDDPTPGKSPMECAQLSIQNLRRICGEA